MACRHGKGRLVHLLNVLLLGLVSLLTDISTEMTYPLLPFYLMTRLGASPSAIGLIEGVAESMANLLKVVAGRWSDRLGRRKPLALGGYGGSALSKLLLAAAGSWPAIIAARLVDRTGKGLRGAPRDALIAESTDPITRGRAFGLHRAMDTLGAALGVYFAYRFLAQEGRDFNAVFWLAAIPALLGAALVLAVRERRAPHPHPRPAPGSLRLEWTALPRDLRRYIVVMVLFTLGNSSNQFLLLRASNLGAPVGKVLLLYLVFNLVYALAAYPAGLLSDRIGRRTLLVAGYATYGLVYFGFARAQQLPALWWLFAAYGIYQGLTEGVEKALLADLAPTDRRATVLGLHGTLVGITLLPASLLAGLVWDTLGAAAPFYLGGTLGCGAAVALWFVLARPAARRASIRLG